jgi:pyruvate-formate lyase-activating enzyme
VRIDLKLGFRCNNRCRFCVQGKKRETFGCLTTEQVAQKIVEARRYSDEVVFTGGEVTIRRDLVDLVALARRQGFRVIQIQTNGRMLAYEKLARRLLAAGATEFSPALHGHTAELHDYLTRCPGSFEQTVAGVRNLRRLGAPVITNTVVTRSNFRHLERLASLLVSLGVCQYQLAFVHALGEARRCFASVVPRMELIAPYVMAGLAVGRRANVRATTEAIPPCILPGYEEHLAEWVLPDARIYDAKAVLESYAQYRTTEGKAKGPRCAQCGWEGWCEGPWVEYPERFGWSEFEPVSRADVERTLARIDADPPQ